MGFKVRRLPCQCGDVINVSSLPDNVIMFNPSVAYPILCFRAMSMIKTHDISDIVLHNIETKKIEIISTCNHLLPNVNLYQGLEDVRVVWHNSRLWFTASSTHASEHMISDLVVGYFNEALSDIEAIVTIDVSSRPIKNICPFVHDNKIKLLDLFTSTIYTLDSDKVDKSDISVVDKSDIYKVELQHCEGVSIDGIRGSCSPIHLHGNVWGCVGHDCIFYDNSKFVSKLSYLHYWIEFDIVTKSITFVSSPFWIARWGVEFVSGIHYQNDQVTLYLGVDDTRPMFAVTTLADLRVGKQ